MKKCNNCKKEIEGFWYSFRDADIDATGWCRDCIVNVRDNYPNQSCYKHGGSNGTKLACAYCFDSKVEVMNWDEYEEHKKECSEKKKILGRERERENNCQLEIWNSAIRG